MVNVVGLMVDLGWILNSKFGKIVWKKKRLEHDVHFTSVEVFGTPKSMIFIDFPRSGASI